MTDREIERAALTLASLLPNAIGTDFDGQVCGAQWPDAYGSQEQAAFRMIARAVLAAPGDEGARADGCGDLPGEASLRWQDVGIAPRDGSELFFLRTPPYGATGNICIGFWHDGQDEPGWVESGTGRRIATNVWTRYAAVPTSADLDASDALDGGAGARDCANLSGEA